jgi:predicted nucleic acid-binding Zn finger protein
MIFVDKNNYILVPNFCMLSFYAKMHLWGINDDFMFVRNIYS